MKIRQETPADYAEVEQIVNTAFTTVSHGDGTEVDYLNEVRAKDAFIPELSLVAESDDGKIIGQIVLYKTPITTLKGELTELVLSPISVHPDYFRRGIARAMVERALGIAQGMGFRAVFLCGDSAFYTRLGFLPTYKYGIFHVKDESKTTEWSMVRELYSGALDGVSGTVDME